MERKIAFFDVDKTLIHSDSMFDFLLFTFKTRPISSIPTFFSISKSIIKYVLSGRKDIRILKEGIFYMTQFMKEEEMMKFTRDILVEKKMFKHSLEEIEKRKYEGCMVVLVSASPEIYLEHLHESLEVDKIIGTRMDDKAKIVGENCKHIEKIKRIEEWLEEKSIKIDYENSYAYSDSFSADKPMLELVKHRYLINSNRVLDGYNNLKWSR